MNALMRVPVRRSLGQGQGGQIVVIDANDRPVSGASVTITNGPFGETDRAGIFRMSSVPGGLVSITVQKGEYAVQVTKDASELASGAYIKIPVCLGQPIVTPVEIGALAVGIGCAIGGVYWKSKPAEVVGEVLIGAAAFTAIYRHSCL